MRRRRNRIVVALLGALVAVLLAAPGAGALQLGVEDPGFLYPSFTPVAASALSAVHGPWTREILRWDLVVPGGATMPSGLDPADPADPHYFWYGYDALVREAAQEHLNLILTLMAAPDWAEGPNRPNNIDIFPGSWDPNVADFAAFAHAAAERYSGHFPDPLNPGANLPHVKYWQIWNEENIPEGLAAPNTISEYRSLLNSGYGAIKGVDPTNVVGFGGLAPVSALPPLSISPLKFAAQVMCLKRVRTKFRRSGPCRQRPHFDFADIHPYTLGATPTTHATSYDDLLVADVGKLQTLIQTAHRDRTIRPLSLPPLWVTEWSWFTNPPNAVVGDPPAVAARYVAYSMYLMWLADVKVVIWFTAQDPQDVSGSTAEFVSGGGLYSSSGQPKPVLRAFTFPMVASVKGRQGFAWGRTPRSRRSRVQIQRRRGGRWVPVISVWTHGGTFRTLFHASHQGIYRAHVLGGPTSLGYNSRPIRPGRTHSGFPF